MPLVTWDSQADFGTRLAPSSRSRELAQNILTKHSSESMVVAGSGLGAGVMAFREGGANVVGLDSSEYLQTRTDIDRPVLGDIRNPPSLTVDLGVTERLLSCFTDDELPAVFAGANTLTERWVHVVTGIKPGPYWTYPHRDKWNMKSLTEWKTLQPAHWFVDLETHQWL